MQHILRRAAVAGLLVGAVLVVYLTPIRDMLSYETFVVYRNELKALVGHYYLRSVIVYLLVYILAMIFSLPVGAALTMAGGFLFGIIPALCYVLVAATLGAIGAFFATRYVLGDWVQRRYADRLAVFNREVEAHAASYLLGLRFTVVIPFFVVNLLAGLSRVSLNTFIWTTVVGIFPATLLFTYAGAVLADIVSVQQLFSWKLIVGVIVLVLIAFVPLIRRFVKIWF